MAIKTMCVLILLLSVINPVTAQEQTADGGYILAGSTNSYSHGDHDFLVYKLDRNGHKQWRKNYGGVQVDNAMAIRQTADGGYLVVGATNSYSNGAWDMLLYRLDANGNKLWRRNYGGVYNEFGYDVWPTPDGGCVIAGESDTYRNGSSGYDFLVYRLDANGHKLWRRNYGGEWSEAYGFIRGTAAGGFILSGVSDSYDYPWRDFLVYKLDADGNKQWRRGYGGADSESYGFITPTGDGGYLLSGATRSYTHQTARTSEKDAFTSADFLIYKLDAAGTKRWRKNYGGSGNDLGYMAVETSDGGACFIGYSASYTNGLDDFLVYRLDAAGSKHWRKNYGGVARDRGYYVIAVDDGGFLLFGETDSYYTGEFMNMDLLVYKIDADGNKTWRKNYGGTGYERAFWID
jgi:hypothetical protein